MNARHGAWWLLAALLVAGASGRAATPAASDRVVSLPPLIVEEKDSPLRWRYLALPRLEVLSVCDDDTSEKFIRRHLAIDQLLGLVLPKRFRVHLAVPEMHVLFNENTGRAHSRELIDEMVKKQGATVAPDGTIRLPPARRAGWRGFVTQRIRFLPNVRLTDIDAVGIFSILQENLEGPALFTFARDRIAFLLTRRAPALPEWFIAGLLELYPQMRLGTDEIEFQPFTWISAEETKPLADDPEWPRTLVPLAELFSSAPADGDAHAELVRIRRAQSALFVRWALTDKTGVRREALWRWLDRLDTAAPDEAAFHACFGIGYSDARDRLADYLTRAVRNREVLPGPKNPPEPKIRFRPASELEIARIRGDWERLQIRHVRANYPSLTETYINQARRTLMRVYQGGETDPQILAVLGLTECDAGNPALARSYLEAAVKTGVVRPRAYFELARMRFDELRGGDKNRRLTADEARTVTTLLLRTCRDAPPLAEVYGLLAETWLQTDAPTPAEDLAAIADGVRLFPGVPAFIARAIQVHVNNHSLTAAAQFVDLALAHIQNPRLRGQLERMRSELGQTLR